MRKLLLLTVGALLLASCNGGGTVTPPTEQPNPPIETLPPTNPNPPTNPPTTPNKPLYIPNAGAAVGTGDGTKEGTIYVSPSADEIELLKLVNEVRTKGTVNGTDVTANSCVAGKFTPLKSLTYNGLYSFSARKHADYITNVADEAHVESQTTSPFFYGRTVNDRVVRAYNEQAGISKYYVGDNIINYGGELTAPARETASQSVEAWMHSSGHCSALMDVDVYDIGVGRSYRSNTNDEDRRTQNAWVIIVSIK